MSLETRSVFAFVMALSGIYAILDADSSRDVEALCDAVLAGGVRLVQYRAKAGVSRQILRRLYKRTSAAAALLIVNDDLEAAVDCDGVHLGQEDLAAAGDVRRRLGSAILGVSAGTLRELEVASAFEPDYVGAGPYRESTTKRDAGRPIGPEGLRAVTSATALPVAAIGGIGLDDLPLVRSSGARMAALVSALALAPSPADAAALFVRKWAELGP